jgi:hypothetical protein
VSGSFVKGRVCSTTSALICTIEQQQQQQQQQRQRRPQQCHSATPSVPPCSPEIIVCAAMLCLCHLRQAQPCNVAADARLSQLLQPACEGMLQLQRMALGLLVGPGFFKHNPDSYLACTGIVNSSQTLAWYQQVAYGLFVLCAGFGYLEWRLKTMFIQQRLGKRLVYGPWHFVSRTSLGQRSSSVCAFATESTASKVHGVLTYGLAVPAGLSVLWFVSLWLVPRIPHGVCDATCEDIGTCITFKPCGECVDRLQTLQRVCVSVCVDRELLKLVVSVCVDRELLILSC